MSVDLSQQVTMSIVRALWGEITPDVRAVLGRIDGEKALTIEFYVDGEVEGFAEIASCVESEVIADFPIGFEISHKVIRLDVPAPIPIADGILVYLRKEAA